MRKSLILALILLFSFGIFIIILLRGWYEQYKLRKAGEMFEAVISKCPFPEKQGINICCYNNGKLSLCNEKETFECGEKIEVRARLDDVDIPSYLCINQTFYFSPPAIPTDWTVFYPDAIFHCSVDPKPDPDVLSLITRLPVDFYWSGIFYNTTGLRKLVEVRTFPAKNYTTLTDLLEDLESSKIVLEVEKMIVC